MNTLNITLYDFFRKDLKVEDTRAKEIVETIEKTIAQEVEDRINVKNTSTKTDIKELELKIEQLRTEMHKVVFWAGLLQVFAILGGLVAIIKFMLDK